MRVSELRTHWKIWREFRNALSTEVLFEIKSVTLAGFSQVYSMLRDTAQ